MNRSELVKAAANESGISQEVTKRVIDAMTEVIMDAVEGGNDVQITGFGKFECIHRKERSGINSFTKKPFTTPAHDVPKFVAAQAFKDQVR